MNSSSLPESLAAVVSAPGYAARALDVILRVARAPDRAAAVELLHDGAHALGAEQAVFASFVRDDESRDSFRFLLACDPVWCFRYQEQGWFADDPWLRYAMTNSEPIAASRIPLRTSRQREFQRLATEFGCASFYIVPAPSSVALSRLGVLGLGSHRAGFFECAAIDAVKILARGLAMELNEWCAGRVREEILAKCRLSTDELELLRMEYAGLGTKEICRELGLTATSVNSRFQRLINKMATPNRRVAARLAAEYGCCRESARSRRGLGFLDDPRASRAPGLGSAPRPRVARVPGCLRRRPAPAAPPRGSQR
jgi:DNA-binding CsgD family transcriptional regulator